MSEDEFDALPDDFADISGVDWDTLLAAPPGPGQQVGAPPENASQLSNRQPSTSYFSDGEELDESFLAAVDRAEQQALARLSMGQPPSEVAPVVANSHSSAQPDIARPSGISALSSTLQLANEPPVRSSRHFPDPPVASSSKTEYTRQKSISVLPCKRPPPEDSVHSSPKGKSKAKSEPRLQEILSSYEDELTCPICCDLLVASQVGNPCGHTFCGECGWQWHIENKNKGCPCCRQDLDQEIPMIPNIAIDNTVEKHVQALSLSGLEEWDVGGRKFKEWTSRQERWKKGSAKRERKKARRPRSFIPVRTFGFLDHLEQLQLPADDLNEDPTYEDSDVELIPRPIRRARRGRRRGSEAVLEVG
ncbi:hypothetical protein CPB83DRAFT_888214 [Crepidotus variabilis]|uniref:RING-type domain-containing protein n=1 Tax=Crepidotus variabilis TaxID=179855 RepID=A0A9P6EVH2_9AGAR|nr:hypothetical protein CPB83DRAFT_888214 [Crepidotus variabilis]